MVRLAWFAAVALLVVACGSSAEPVELPGARAAAGVGGEDAAGGAAPVGGGGPGGSGGTVAAGGSGTGGATSTAAGGAGGAAGSAGGAGGAAGAGGGGGTGGTGGASTTSTGAAGAGGSPATDAGAPDAPATPDASAVPYAPDFSGPWAHGLCWADAGALKVDCNGDGKCETLAPDAFDCGLCAPFLVCPAGYQCQASSLGEKDPKTAVTSVYAAFCEPI